MKRNDSLERDLKKDKNWLIWVIIGISLITYLFYEYIDIFLTEKGFIQLKENGEVQNWFWFRGNAFFILIMSSYILWSVKNKTVAFILFGYALNNLADELFFDPTVLGLNEIIFAVIVPIMAIFIHRNYANTRRKK